MLILTALKFKYKYDGVSGCGFSPFERKIYCLDSNKTLISFIIVHTYLV